MADKIRNRSRQLVYGLRRPLLRQSRPFLRQSCPLLRQIRPFLRPRQLVHRFGEAEKALPDVTP